MAHIKASNLETVLYCIIEITGDWDYGLSMMSGKYSLEHGKVGERHVLSQGHISKRDLYHRMCAFVEGLRAHKRGNLGREQSTPTPPPLVETGRLNPACLPLDHPDR